MSQLPSVNGSILNTASAAGTTTAIEAAETTRIPVDARAGHYGPIAYFAVLCYPGIDPQSHRRRNQFTTAVLEYFRGIIKLFADVEHGQLACDPGARQPLLAEDAFRSIA